MVASSMRAGAGYGGYGASKWPNVANWRLAVPSTRKDSDRAGDSVGRALVFELNVLARGVAPRTRAAVEALARSREKARMILREAAVSVQDMLSGSRRRVGPKSSAAEAVRQGTRCTGIRPPGALAEHDTWVANLLIFVHRYRRRHSTTGRAVAGATENRSEPIKATALSIKGRAC